MKIWMLVVTIIGLSLTCATRAGDLPRMGYSPGIAVNDLPAHGYRWVSVDGPYACATEQELRQITSEHTDLTELRLLEDGGTYYLIPGALVRVIQDDHANAMSEILLGGITRPLWTYTKFLTARPIKDIYGVVETPDTAGLIDPSDPAVAGSALNEWSRGGTR